MDSAQERQGYPERTAFLAARRARHPSEDRMDDFTNWTILGQPADDPDAEANFQETHPLPGSPGKIVAPPPAAEPTYEEYIKKRTEFLMHKNMSTRRGYGGMLFSMNGGGDGGCAYQVAGAHTGNLGSHHSGVNYANWPPADEVPKEFVTHPNALHQFDVQPEARQGARARAGKAADAL